MKPQQADLLRGLSRVVRNGIGRQPVFAQPDVKQQHRNESSEVEDIFLNRHPMPECRSENPQCRLRIREEEEPSRTKKIEQPSRWHQNPDRPPERSLRNF